MTSTFRRPVLDMLAFQQQEQFFPSPGMLMQRNCVYVPLARLKFFGVSMTQHRGVDLTMIVKMSTQSMPLIASIDCPVSIKLYPHPDMHAPPSPPPCAMPLVSRRFARVFPPAF